MQEYLALKHLLVGFKFPLDIKKNENLNPTKNALPLRSL
jgi:hypothetical protein